MDWVEAALKRAAEARRANGQDSSAVEPRLTGVTIVPLQQLERFPDKRESTPSPVPETPVLAQPTGSAPAQGEEGASRLGFSAALAEKLVVMRETRPVVVEQFRKLAATLHEIQRGRQLKVLMVASAVAGEGKTFTALNLALTLSESFRNTVLLMDADLRRPQMHEHFRVAGVNGLAAGDDHSLEVIQITPTLQLLAAGRPDPDPMRVLTSDRIRQLIADAAARFDWVLVDCPPVADLPDAHLLAGLVDAAIVVAAAGRTPYTAIARAVDTVGRERVVGVVLNHVDESAMSATRELAYGYLGASPDEGADTA